VIDGDTIEAPYGVKYRLLGFDTPETYFSKCDEELALGRKATERLKELLASGEVKIIETGKTGKYGRSLAFLHVNGRDVGQIMISEGSARPYDGGRRQGWCG
jgi:endonuclease YncB( thermonuclease family)